MATNATATIAGNLLSGNWSAANLLGTDPLAGSIALPAFKAIEFLNGNGVGQVNRIGFAAGTLTNVTPGTTDTALVNLASLTDLNGNTFTDMTKLVAALFFNDAVTAGYNLVYGNSGTNDFADLFNGTATSVLKLPPASWSGPARWRAGRSTPPTRSSSTTPARPSPCRTAPSSSAEPDKRKLSAISGQRSARAGNPRFPG